MNKSNMGSMRVEVLDAMTSDSIENKINAFLMTVGNTIEVVSIDVKTNIFKDEGEVKCYYLATIQYTG